MALKDAMLRDEIRTLQEELKRKPTMERIMEIQQRLIQINEIRVQLAKELGERIVVR